MSAPTALRALRRLLLERTSLVLFVLVFSIFGALAPVFFAPQNLLNILIHASTLGIVATGMTFVLVVAGIDLSVGSVMFVATCVAGKLLMGGAPLPLALLAALPVALAFGAVNALFIVRFRLLAFVVTLATLYVGRGFGLFLTETRAMNLPAAVQALGAARPLGVPFPLLVFALVAITAHLVLQRTAFGRQVYAVGHSAEAATRAGLPVRRILFVAYLVCAACAGLAGLVAMAQIGAVSPSFGRDRELAAIAAAVLGGTSLFGGRGQVLPGTVLGALLIQTVETGLVILKVDPYLFPLVTAGIIFVALAADSLRNRELVRQKLRKIRPQAAAP
jgi:ribose transport system permease protein